MKFSLYIASQLILGTFSASTDKNTPSNSNDQNFLNFFNKQYPDQFEIKELISKTPMSKEQKAFANNVLTQTDDVDIPVENNKVYHILDKDFSKKFENKLVSNVKETIKEAEFAQTEAFNSVSSASGSSEGSGGAAVVEEVDEDDSSRRPSKKPVPISLRTRFLRDYDSIKVNPKFINAFNTWKTTTEGRAILKSTFGSFDTLTNEKYNIWKVKEENKKTSNQYIGVNDSNLVYNMWINTTAGVDALKQLFNTSGAYTTALNGFKALDDNNATSSQYANSSSSISQFKVWIETQDGFDALTSVFKATKGATNSYAIKAAKWIIENTHTIDDYISANASTATFNQWITTTAGRSSLKDFFEAASAYNTALTSYKNNTANHSTATEYVDDRVSNNTFATWAATQDAYDDLQDAFKSSTGAIPSYAAAKTKWKIENPKSAIEYATANASTSIYNTWITTTAGRNLLKGFFNSTDDFTNAYNTYKAKAVNHKPTTGYADDVSSNAKYTTWLSSVDGFNALKDAFKATKGASPAFESKAGKWKIENPKSESQFLADSASDSVFNTWAATTAGTNDLKTFFNASDGYTPAFNTFKGKTVNHDSSTNYADSTSSNAKFALWVKTQDAYDVLVNAFKATKGVAPAYQATAAAWITANPWTPQEFVNDNASNDAYNQWITTSAAREVLKGFFFSSDAYTPALNSYKNKVKYHKSAPDYADDPISNDKYIAWYKTVDGFNKLKNIFKDTKGSSISYATKSSTWINANPKTIAQYLSNDSSTAVYDKWITTTAGRDVLKSIFNATDEYTTAYNNFKNKAANQKSAPSYVNSSASNSAYNNWIETQDGFDVVKNHFKKTTGTTNSYATKSSAWIVANPSTSLQYANHVDSDNVYNVWRKTADAKPIIENTFKSNAADFNPKLADYQSKNPKSTSDFWIAKKDTNVFTSWLNSTDGQNSLSQFFEASTTGTKAFTTKFLTWLKDSARVNAVSDLWQSLNVADTTYNNWRLNTGWESVAAIWKETQAGQTALNNYPKVPKEFLKVEYLKTSYGKANTSDANFNAYSAKSVALRKYDQFDAYMSQFLYRGHSFNVQGNNDVYIWLPDSNNNPFTSFTSWINSLYTDPVDREAAKVRLGTALANNGIDFDDNDDTFTLGNILSILKATASSSNYVYDNSLSNNSSASLLDPSIKYSYNTYEEAITLNHIIIFAKTTLTSSDKSNISSVVIPNTTVANVQYKINGMYLDPDWYKTTAIKKSIDDWSVDKKVDTTNKDGATPQNDVKTLFSTYIKANKASDISTWVENNYMTNDFAGVKNNYKATNNFVAALKEWVIENKNTASTIKSEFMKATSSSKTSGDNMVKTAYRNWSTPSKADYLSSDTFSADALKWVEGKKTSNTSIKNAFIAAMTSSKTNGDEAVKAAFDKWRVKDTNNYEATGVSGQFGTDLAIWAKTLKDSTTGKISIIKIRNDFITATASTSANGNKALKDVFDVWKIKTEDFFKTTKNYNDALESWATDKKNSNTPNIKAVFTKAINGTSTDSGSIVGHNEVATAFNSWKVPTSDDYEATGFSGEFGKNLRAWAATLKDTTSGDVSSSTTKAAFASAAKSNNNSGDREVKVHYDRWKLPSDASFKTSTDYGTSLAAWATGKKLSTNPDVKSLFIAAAGGLSLDTSELIGNAAAKAAYDKWKPKPNSEYEATGKSGQFGTDLATWAATVKNQTTGAINNSAVKQAFSAAAKSTSTSGNKDVKDHFDIWKLPSEATFNASSDYGASIAAWARGKKLSTTPNIKAKFSAAIYQTSTDSGLIVGHNAVRLAFTKWRVPSDAEYEATGRSGTFGNDLRAWASTLKDSTVGTFSNSVAKNAFATAAASSSTDGNKDVKDHYDVWKIPSQAMFKTSNDYNSALATWATGKKLSTTPNIKAEFIKAIDETETDTSSLTGHNAVKAEYDKWKLKSDAEYEATGKSGAFGTDLATWAATAKNQRTGTITNSVVKRVFIAAAASTSTDGNKAVKDHFDSWKLPSDISFKTSNAYNSALATWATGKKANNADLDSDASGVQSIKAEFIKALDRTSRDTRTLTGHNAARAAYDTWKVRTEAEYEATGKSGEFGTDLLSWAKTTKHDTTGLMNDNNARSAFASATTSTSTSGNKTVKDHFDTWKLPSHETFQISDYYFVAIKTWAVGKKDSTTPNVKAQFASALDGTLVDNDKLIGHAAAKREFEVWRIKPKADYITHADFTTDFDAWLSSDKVEATKQIKDTILTQINEEANLDANTKALIDIIKQL